MRTNGSSTGSMNAAGSPPGGTAPKASRKRPASSEGIQRSSPPIRICTARRSPSSWPSIAAGQVAEPAQDVVKVVGRRGLTAVAKALQVGLDLLQRAGVDQIPQLLLPE